MVKIAIALSKGGVGKTTTAVNLAAGLAQAGKMVLLVDVDTQGQVARSLGIKPPYGLAELAAGEVDYERACIPARPGLWLLAGGRVLAGLKRTIARKDFGGERTLAEALEGPDVSFDYILLDTSPGWDTLTVNALFYADKVLAPVSLEVLTLQSLMDFSRSLVSIQKYKPGLNLAYILPTFLDRRVKKSEEILSQLQTHFGERVCEPVRINVRLSEAPGFGQSIFEYAPNSPGAQDYRQLSERIIEDERP